MPPIPADSNVLIGSILPDPVNACVRALVVPAPRNPAAAGPNAENIPPTAGPRKADATTGKIGFNSLGTTLFITFLTGFSKPPKKYPFRSAKFSIPYCIIC